MLDATKIAPRLYVGSYPNGPAAWRELADRRPPFTMLVLCAKELQALYPGELLPLTIVRIPLDDDPFHPLTPYEAGFVIQAAAEIAGHVRRGGRALCVCAMGVNRSALVAALALHRLTGWSGETCTAAVRAAREPALRARGAPCSPLSSLQRVVRRVPVALTRFAGRGVGWVR